MSNRTIPVISPAMNLGIDQGISPIVLAPQTLLKPTMKEVVADTALGGAWINRTLQQLIRVGVDGSNTGDIRNSVSIVEPPSPVLIEIVGTYPTCGINVSQQVANKRQSTSPGLVGHTQNLDTVVDGKLPDNFDSTSIFRNMIGHRLYDVSSPDVYIRCRMNFAADPVQTQTPQSMVMGFSIITSLDEISGLGNPATRIRRPADGAHWSTPNHFFCSTTAVGLSKVEYDYNYN